MTREARQLAWEWAEQIGREFPFLPEIPLWARGFEHSRNVARTRAGRGMRAGGSMLVQLQLDLLALAVELGNAKLTDLPWSRGFRLGFTGGCAGFPARLQH